MFALLPKTGWAESFPPPQVKYPGRLSVPCLLPQGRIGRAQRRKHEQLDLTALMCCRFRSWAWWPSPGNRPVEQCNENGGMQRDLPQCPNLCICLGGRWKHPPDGLMLSCCLFSSSWEPAVEKTPCLPPSWANAPLVCWLLAVYKASRSASLSLIPQCMFITSSSLPSPCRGSVFLSTLARLVSRLAIPVGNCIAWSMALGQMASSPPLRPQGKQGLPLGPSSVRRAQGSMCQEQC